MKFWVTGFADRRGNLLGDILVIAPDRATALTAVRRTGRIPNPGDVYVVRPDYSTGNPDVAIGPEDLDRARNSSDSTVILWDSSE
jgi:hypothetical protein